MIKLSRVNMINWYAFTKKSVNLTGSTALVGPNGAGKSSILDAIQVVLTGNNRNHFSLNASANVTAGQRRGSGQQRSVFDYCLGRVNGETLRDKCLSYLSLVFEREKDGKCWTIGLGIYASSTEQSEEVLGAFIAEDQNLTCDDFCEVIDGQTHVLDYEQLALKLARVKGFNNFGHRPANFTRAVLMALGRDRHHADPVKFLKTLKNGLRIREMKSATEFVREFLLDEHNLNLDDLRQSMASWHSLLDQIHKLDRQKVQVTHAIAAYTDLIEKIANEEAYSWVANLAERDRLEKLLETDSPKHEENITQEKRAENNLKRTRESLERLQKEINDIEAALASSDKEQAIARFKAVDLPRAQAEKATALTQYHHFLTSVVSAANLADDLVMLYRKEDFQNTQGVLAALRRRVSGADKIRSADVDEIIRSARGHLQTYASEAIISRDQHLGRINNLNAELQVHRDQLKSIQAGGALLRPETIALMELLGTNGIKSQPLAEVVEVTDSIWADAAELLLGGAREALIVEPADAKQAITLLRQERHRLKNTQIINTTKTAAIDRQPRSGSIAEILVTENPHARAFLNIRLNGFRRVETEAELLANERAVTPEGLVSASGSIKNTPFERTKLLGKDASLSNVPVLQGLMEETERSLHSTRNGAERLNTLIKAMENFLLISGAQSLEELELTKDEAGEAVSQIEDNIRTLESERPTEIRDQLKHLQDDLAGYKKQQGEDDTALRIAAQNVGSSEAQLANRKAELDRANSKFNEFDLGFMGDRDNASSLYKELMQDHRHIWASVRGAANKEVDSLGKEIGHLRSEAPTKLSAYVYEAELQEQWNRDASYAEQLEWLKMQLETIINNNLTDYREQAERAQAEIELSLKTDLLLKLNERIDGAKVQIQSLNRSLQHRAFHNERYKFEVKPDRQYSEIVEIARRVSQNSLDVSPLFSSQAADIEPTLLKGVERLKRMIEDGEDVAELSDYRNYLQFELLTTSLDGERVTSDYSKRQGSGSGGERQSPFYVAMACAMSNVCHSSETNREKLGLGIILFDEAFNALDGGNVNSCLSLLREFNLQVIACAPTEKLPVFMEKMDTILHIRRNGSKIQLDSEELKAHARHGFERSNPANIEFDQFKEDYIKAELADAAP